ncbi:MAG: DAK2 domain-containing protein [Thermoleophilia bacterium]
METTSRALFTAPRVRALVKAGYLALEARRQEINDLNVYPVPDGDTGTNLALTIQAVLEELRRVPDSAGPKELSEAIGRAALMGARGNSGVILSQMVRGAMEVFGTGEDFSDDLLARAFHRATDTAYRAIRKPVEGTMLTVLREMKDAAEERAKEGDHRTMMHEVLKAGWEGVRRTPEQLEVLAEAGVVDAGGYGLLVFVEGMIAGAEGEEIAADIDLDRLSAKPEIPVPSLDEDALSAGDFTYCTTFFLSGGKIGAEDLEGGLAGLGDSLLVVGEPGSLKVHIHTDDPGEVLSLAVRHGMLSGIEIDNMRLQTTERNERLQSRDLATDAREPARESRAPASATEVVAVVAGNGNKQLFGSLGATRIVEGGQSMNPSAEELLAAVEATTAPSVLILPNNKNVVLAAEQVARMTERPVRVIPTTSLQAGLAAMVLFDPEQNGEQNARSMCEALEYLRTAEITRAVRDSRFNGLDIEEGTFLGLVDGEMVVTDRQLDCVLAEVAERLIGPETEVLTVLVGDEASAGSIDLEATVEGLRERYPDLEVEVHAGGQPLYPLLLAAE